MNNNILQSLIEFLLNKQNAVQQPNDNVLKSLFGNFNNLNNNFLNLISESTGKIDSQTWDKMLTPSRLDMNTIINTIPLNNGHPKGDNPPPFVPGVTPGETINDTNQPFTEFNLEDPGFLSAYGDYQKKQRQNSTISGHGLGLVQSPMDFAKDYFKNIKSNDPNIPTIDPNKRWNI